MMHAHLSVKWTLKIVKVQRGANFYMCCSNSSNMSKLKNKTEYFVWTEAKLLFKVTIDYKVTKTSKNVKSGQTKYSGILHMFVAQYLSPEEIISTIALHVLLVSQYTSKPLYAKQNVKLPFTAIFFRAGRLDPILTRHPFRKVPFSSVHTETRKRRFKKNSLWRAFPKSCVFGDLFHRIRVDNSGQFAFPCLLSPQETILGWLAIVFFFENVGKGWGKNNLSVVFGCFRESAVVIFVNYAFIVYNSTN